MYAFVWGCVLMVTPSLAYDCVNKPTFEIEAVWVDEPSRSSTGSECFGWHGDPDTASMTVVKTMSSTCEGVTYFPFRVPAGVDKFGGQEIIFTIDSNGDAGLVTAIDGAQNFGQTWPIEICLEKYSGFFCDGTYDECKLRLTINSPSNIEVIIGVVVPLVCCCCCIVGLVCYRQQRASQRNRTKENFSIKAKTPQSATNVSVVTVQQPTMGIAMQPMQQPTMGIAMQQPTMAMQQPVMGGMMMQQPAMGGGMMQQPYAQPVLDTMQQPYAQPVLDTMQQPTMGYGQPMATAPMAAAPMYPPQSAPSYAGAGASGNCPPPTYNNNPTLHTYKM